MQTKVTLNIMGCDCTGGGAGIYWDKFTGVALQHRGKDMA